MKQCGNILVSSTLVFRARSFGNILEYIPAILLLGVG